MVSASPKPTRTAAHPPATANASASDLAAAMRRSSAAEPAGAVPTPNAPPSPPDSYSTTTVEPRASSRVSLRPPMPSRACVFRQEDLSKKSIGN